jgi:hypothetical protein
MVFGATEINANKFKGAIKRLKCVFDFMSFGDIKSESWIHTRQTIFLMVGLD